MSRSTANLGPWNGRYGVRFDVEDGVASMRLTRLLLDGSTAHLDYPDQEIGAANLVAAMKTRNRLENAIEAARYWKSEWKIERDTRALPLAAGLMGVGGFMLKYLLGSK